MGTASFRSMEADDATAHLYTTESLFTTTTDQNQIASGIDSTRYLDYHIAIKDAVIDNKFVVWVNEQTVNQKQVRLSNITLVTMMEEPVTSIGPRTVTPITNVTPGVSGFAVAGFARYGFHPDNDAKTFSVGVQWDFNSVKLKKRFSKASEL